MYKATSRQNRLIYTLSALILLSGAALYGILNSSGGVEPAGEIVAETAPLAEATTTPAAPAVAPTLPQAAPVATVSPVAKPADKPAEKPVAAAAPAPAKPAPVAASTSPTAKKTINLSVPFTSQAPLGDWSDSRQQDGCEEASVLMAMAWVEGEAGVTPAVWEKRITDLADWEEENYGEHRDVSVQDAVDWMFKDKFGYDQVRVETIKKAADIVAALEKGALVLAPMNGRALHNPNFTAPGPEHHFIVIKGYDYAKKQFITNDPGTRRGADYRYSETVIMSAIRAYPTGYHSSYPDVRQEVIIVEK